MFYGKRLADMDRAELLQVIEYLSGRVEGYAAPGMSRAYALGKVEMLKRGENAHA